MKELREANRTRRSIMVACMLSFVAITTMLCGGRELMLGDMLALGILDLCFLGIALYCVVMLIKVRRMSKADVLRYHLRAAESHIDQMIENISCRDDKILLWKQAELLRSTCFNGSASLSVKYYITKLKRAADRIRGKNGGNLAEALSVHQPDARSGRNTHGENRNRGIWDID